MTQNLKIKLHNEMAKNHAIVWGRMGIFMTDFFG
jgi:hypothetical protein